MSPHWKAEWNYDSNYEPISLGGCRKCSVWIFDQFTANRRFWRLFNSRWSQAGGLLLASALILLPWVFLTSKVDDYQKDFPPMEILYWIMLALLVARTVLQFYFDQKR